jgi:VanZ family protein
VTRALRGWLPALLWAALIFALSSRPTLATPRIAGIDKVAHFGAYAVLGALLSHAGIRSGVPAVPLLALGVLYGASDEWHQSFVPGRSPDVADWGADVLGVAAGLLLHRRWLRTRSPHGP